jgi:branched-chain amino acid transport system substrate-binding protein
VSANGCSGRRWFVPRLEMLAGRGAHRGVALSERRLVGCAGARPDVCSRSFLPTRGRRQLRVFRWGGVQVAVVALGVLVGVSGCQQAQSGQAGADLKIVALTQISRDGDRDTPAPTVVPADPADGAGAHCAAVSIAVLAPLTGPDAALGANVNDGAQLAINEHNAANPACAVTLKPFDTEGDPQKAAGIALQVVDDPAIIGVIGPGNSGEVRVVQQVFEQAGVVAATPSATNAALARNNWRTFIRGLGNDEVQGPSVAGYLRNTLGAKRICVVDDSTDYGLGLAKAVAGRLGPAAIGDCTVEVKRGDKDFSAAVTQIKNSQPDAVFYGGYYAEAAILVHQLRDAGVEATFASGDASNDVEFVKQAGDAAMNALLSCPCAPAAGAFGDRYQKAFSRPAGTYSAESYDLATIMVKGIDAGQVTRPALLDYIHHYHGQGVARTYQWDPNGELTDTRIWIYKVQ